jgi:Alpha/beta hydrolase family
MQTQDELGMNLSEDPGYFQVAGAHLYTVLHAVADPVARVLLVGPFASERNFSYIPWVRWARYLAARRIECLRYDYRGMGESTGAFEEMSLTEWIEDVELLAAWLNGRTPGVPLVLHGLELGALLASKVFESRVGDALLMWSVPKSASELLRAVLLKRVAIDNMFKYGDERKAITDYLQQLETGPLEVDGYRWSSRLWRDAFRLELPAGMEDDGGVACACKRPVRMVRLDQSAEPLVKGSTCVSINPDLGGLFADNFEWITTALAINSGGSSGTIH